MYSVFVFVDDNDERPYLPDVCNKEIPKENTTALNDIVGEPPTLAVSIYGGG